MAAGSLSANGSRIILALWPNTALSVFCSVHNYHINLSSLAFTSQDTENGCGPVLQPASHTKYISSISQARTTPLISRLELLRKVASRVPADDSSMSASTWKRSLILTVDLDILRIVRVGSDDNHWQAGYRRPAPRQVSLLKFSRSFAFPAKTSISR